METKTTAAFDKACDDLRQCLIAVAALDEQREIWRRRAFVYLMGALALAGLGALVEVGAMVYAPAGSVLPLLAGVFFALTVIALVAGVANYWKQVARVWR